MRRLMNEAKRKRRSLKLPNLDCAVLRCEAAGCAEADSGACLVPWYQANTASTAEALRKVGKLTQFSRNLNIFYHLVSRSIARARMFLLIYMLRDTVKTFNGYGI